MYYILENLLNHFAYRPVLHYLQFLEHKTEAKIFLLIHLTALLLL